MNTDLNFYKIKCYIVKKLITQKNINNKNKNLNEVVLKVKMFQFTNLKIFSD